MAAYDFSRRDFLARQRGWQSYGHERTAKEEAKKMALLRQPELTERFMAAAKQFTTPGQRRAQMRLWVEGARALVAKDHDTADAIGAQLPVPIRVEPQVPESAFWYH